jgi:phosphinothricin acetyltransferase
VTGPFLAFAPNRACGISRKIAMPPQIRLADPEQDALPIAGIYGPFCTRTPATFDLTAPSQQEMGHRISRVLEKMPWLVCDGNGPLLGYAHASAWRQMAAYRWSVEVSIYVASQWQRRGVGRALYTSLLAILRQQGFCNAYAGITLPNDASVALHRSFGFQVVGTYRKVGFKLGQWHDVQWWELTLGPRPSEPSVPRQLPLLLGRPEWHASLEKGQNLLRGAG